MKSTDHPKRPLIRQYVFASLVLLLIGAVAGAIVYRFASREAFHAPLSTVDENAPRLVKQGNRIIIPENSPLRSQLTVASVGQREVERNLILPAVVETDPSRLIKILPPLSGRITQLKVQLGQRVEKTQPLAVLDSPDLQAAYADYGRDKVQVAQAQSNRDRLRALGPSGGVSQKEVQQTETDFLTAQTEYQRAEARLRQIGVDPEVTDRSRTLTILAPIAGSVIDLTVAPGAYWNDATAPLMTLADLSLVWVTANVPEKDTARVAQGQAVDVELAAYPGEIFKGQVLFVSDVVDPDTRRTKVRIAFQNTNARFKPGMFANATFFAPKQVLPIVPAGALVLRDDTNQVFVEVAPWTFEARQVEIGFQQGDQAIVRSGVQAGDRVIVKGGVLLND
ncbi:efflux RND transporter periplasmic adaptor subunit [Bradyrhizobium genosp. A]|uniref:efflux RND transporter periplasmic adaptor subunit n=1 Tax=Bradyrhizobium genosp. A TaxID=83626 RepID=UPI003CF5E052